MKRSILLSGVVMLLAALPNANATIITGAVTSGTGSFVELTPGFTDSDPDNTVGNNNLQNTNLYAFNEDQNTAILNNPLNVDILASTGLAGSLAVGTIVASQYVFFDPRFTVRQTGWVEFDAAILAVITSAANLDASDYLANTGVNYLSSALRGLEWNDSVSIDALNPARLNVDWRAGSPGDYVRVLTAFSPGAVTPTSVPEPGTLLLMAAGLAGVVGVKRRRTRQG